MADAAYWMVAQADLTELGIERGDIVHWDPKQGNPHPFVITRRRSLDYGAILVALDQGVIEPYVLTPGGASAASREGLQTQLARELRPRLRLVRVMG